MRLVSWIGGNDLRLSEGGELKGPVADTLKAFEFSDIQLIYNYPKAQVKPYLQQLLALYGDIVTAQWIALKSPTDFHDITAAADALLSQLYARSNETVAILLSPGTPAMQAVWIILGKARYQVQFYQSSLEQGVESVEIPFTLAAEYLPQQVLKATRQFTDLASGEVSVNAAFDDIITQNPQMQLLKHQATVLAGFDVSVLITGESGTGKELFAAAIHNASQRSVKQFVAVNCGAIPPELIDSVFFGHLKNAFTGANRDKSGYFQQADGGTLFLDEFGELAPSVQVRLLRVLQSGEVMPVGASEPTTVDVRIIAATNRDLMLEVVEGRFREDLFYRVAAGVLHLPPLRQRAGDLLLIASHLLDNIAKQLKLAKAKEMAVEAQQLLLLQLWRGNIRELQTTLLRAVLWSESELVSAADIERALFTLPAGQSEILGRDITQGIDIQKIIDEVVQHYIPRTLAQTANNKTQAAELLGLANPQTLNNWAKKHKVLTD